MPARLLDFSSVDAIGSSLALYVLKSVESARAAGRRFLLGCPTGRTPRPIYDAIAKELAEGHQDISNLVLVMMDEYLVPDKGGFRYADERNPWSCHHFAKAKIVEPWNQALPRSPQVRPDSVWFPDPAIPSDYDRRIREAGGIDFFILASGASDGHVAFNPPGSPRDSMTRIIALSEETRRDNLITFPEFGTLEAVPTHGISVGIATIGSAKGSAMVVWGAGKRLTLARMLKAVEYEPDWPATIIHECHDGHIFCDNESLKGLGPISPAPSQRSE